MADQLKQIKEFPNQPDFGDEDLLLIQGQGTTYNIKGAAVKRYAENAAKPQVELAAQEAAKSKEAADRAEAAIQHPAIPNPTTKNWMVWDQVSGSYVETTPPVRAEGLDFEIKGYYPTLEALETAVPVPGTGDAYGVGTEEPYDIYVWDAVNDTWVNNGALQGPRGEPGPAGPQGPAGPPGPPGTGDMEKSTYDPTGKNQDIFSYAELMGLPTGGTTGQILSKASGANRDVKWASPPATGVTSFKDRTGAVTPSSGDYSVSQVTGAAPIASPAFTGSISLSRKSGTTVSANSVALGSGVEASGKYGACAFGYQTRAIGETSFAEGDRTIASGNNAHAEGLETTASGSDAHAGGRSCVADGNHSFAHGYGAIAHSSQAVFGWFNVESQSASDLFIVGDGATNGRANAFRINSYDGVYAKGSYHSSGADYAELFEWADGNLARTDRTGRFVTLEGERIRLAGPEDDYILGIISGSPSVVGDVYDDQWQGMYLTDIFGRPIIEEAEVPAVTEEVEVPIPSLPENREDQPAELETRKETRVVIPAYVERRRKLNPAYDNSQTYMPRTERPEWAAVGMLGKLVAVDDGSCRVNGWAAVGEGGAATNSEERTKYRVMARLDERHVRILIL